METVNNIASAASRAIWGENTTATNETAGVEPVAGQTGDVKAGEPYDKGNEETGKTASGTYLDYQGKDEGTATSNSIANPSSTIPDRTITSDSTPSDNTTSDNTTSDSISTSPPTSTNDNSLSDNSGAPPAPSSKTQSASDPATDPTATTTSKATEPSTSNTTNKDDENSDDKETLAKDGIQEIHSGKEDGAKYDSFKTAGGPHIDHPTDDGRVGPEVPKGTAIPGTEDMNDDAEAREKPGHHSEGATADTTGSATKHESASRESVDSAGKESGGKEKVSLKDKIKAKLHKDKS